MKQVDLPSFISEMLENQPTLEVHENNEAYILTGQYFYDLQHDNLIRRGFKEICIEIPKSYPSQIPIVKVEVIPKGYDHLYKDNSLCLAALGEMICFQLQKPSLLEFATRFIDPVMFTLDHYTQYGTYPFGERAHGLKGLMAYFLEDLKFTKDQYWAMVKLVHTGNYRGHHQCFCGSNKKLRDCHGGRIRLLLEDDQLKQLFLSEAGQYLIPKKK